MLEHTQNSLAVFIRKWGDGSALLLKVIAIAGDLLYDWTLVSVDELKELREWGVEGLPSIATAPTLDNVMTKWWQDDLVMWFYSWYDNMMIWYDNDDNHQCVPWNLVHMRRRLTELWHRLHFTVFSRCVTLPTPADQIFWWWINVIFINNGFSSMDGSLNKRSQGDADLCLWLWLWSRVSLIVRLPLLYVW